MTALTHDIEDALCRCRARAPGLALALVSAVSFGLSGALARPLLDARLERRAPSSWSGSRIAALVVLPVRRSSRCAVAGTCCARNARH